MVGERKPLVEIDLSGVIEPEQLHVLLMDALDFPGYYGCNWDAFWDTISGIVQMPKVLRLLGWRTFFERLPEDAELMWDCLDDLAARYPEDAPEVECVC